MYTHILNIYKYNLCRWYNVTCTCLISRMLGIGKPVKGVFLGKDYFFCFYYSLVAYSFLSQVEDAGDFPFYASLSVGVDLAQVLFRQPCLHGCSFCGIPRRRNVTANFCSSGFLPSLHPCLLQCDRLIRWGWALQGNLFSAFWSVGFSLMVSICYEEMFLFFFFFFFEEMFLWWGVRLTLICGDKNKYLECSWELCWFSKVVIIDSPPNSTTSLAPGSRWFCLVL